MKNFEERLPVVLENEGQKIFGILHLPITHSKVPGILICHGLAGHKTGRYRLYVSLASRLAKEGIATFRFDFRGAGDSEGEFFETTVEGQISDALQALHFLSNHSSIDSKRLGLFGRSFGGAIGILTAAKNCLFKSIVLWAPMFNGNEWLDIWKMAKEGSLPSAKQQEAMRINGQQASVAFFEQFFKINLDHQMDALKTLPFLHIQGEKDDIISIKQADFFKTARQNALGETKFIRFPSGDHHFSGTEEQEKALNATVEWFKRTL